MRSTLFLSLAAVFLAPCVFGASQALQVIVSGQPRAPIAVQRVDGRMFINAKQAGEAYGGQVYWYPISGRVLLSFHGRRVQFVVGSSQVQLGERSVALEGAVVLRASQAYAPLSFFLGEDFTTLSGLESQFDEAAMLLTVDRHCNVGPARWFSYQNSTRLVMELKKPLTHTAGDRAGSGLEVTIPFGVIDAPEKASVEDGLIERYSLSQDVATARLSVRFAKRGLKWRVRELDAPRRLAVEVSAADFEATSSQMPTSIPPAQAPASTAAMPTPAVTEPTAPAPQARAKRRIIIDAGHGGKDGGALGTRSTREKDINLAAAKELASLLGEENLFDVVMTRPDDTFIPLAERSRIANDGKADLFVSLHCNAHRNKRERGFEVYFLSENASDPEAERLAQVENSVVALEGKTPADEEAALILRAMSKTENINDSSELAALISRSLSRRTDLSVRGVKQAGFFVLRGTDAPAVLVEMAFLTNRDDEAKLKTARYRRRLVDGVYAGILEHAKRRHWLERSP